MCTLPELCDPTFSRLLKFIKSAPDVIGVPPKKKAWDSSKGVILGLHVSQASSEAPAVLGKKQVP